MTNINLSRGGVFNADGGTWEKDNAMWLKVFSGEVLTAFERMCVFKELTQKRTIESGRAAQFPVTGRFGAKYHVPGEPILGQGTMSQNEVTIRIDSILVADASLYSLDEAKAHFDVRSIYSNELGEALSREYDRRVARTICEGAREQVSDILASNPAQLDTPIDDPYRTGSRIDMALASPTPNDYVATLFTAAQTLDEKDVHSTNRYAVVTPEVYYTLIQSDRAVNQDFNASDNGSYAGGNIARLAGFTLIPSNHINQGDQSAAPTGVEGQTWNGTVKKGNLNMSNTKMLCFIPSATGVVSLMDLSMNMTGNDYMTVYQSVLLVAKYACGFGFLRPEAAVEVHNSLQPN